MAQLRRQRCTECGSVFYTQDPKNKICGSCAPTPKATAAGKPKSPKPAPKSATAEPDAVTA